MTWLVLYLKERISHIDTILFLEAVESISFSKILLCGGLSRYKQ